MSLLSLNCFVLGGGPSSLFTVKIQTTENVSILKDLIKEKQSHRLDHIDASELTVWKVSLPIDTITPELTVDDIETCQKLHFVNKMFSIFGTAPVDDEHVHILARAPTVNQPVAAPDPTQLLSLNCFVLGEDLLEVFTVEILKTKNVSILKRLIKAEQSHRLDHIDASKLILSQVSLPVNGDLDKSLNNVDLAPLEPLLPLSQVFPLVEVNCLHVVVQAPTNEGLRTKDAGGEEKRDQIPALHKRFENVVMRISKAMAPSDSAKSLNYLKSQMAYSIYDGRYNVKSPRTSVAPPVQLFHPAFGHFLDSVKSNDALPDDIIHQTAKYMTAASAIYPSELTRQNELLPLLRVIFDVNIQTVLNEDRTKPDGLVEVATNKLHFLIFIQEDKNEFGDGGSDPSTQAGLSVGRCWAQPKYKTLRNATACPTFLVATAGPWIAILGAVITDGVIVQRLTDYIWVGLDSVLNESHVAHVARAFYALRTSLKILVSYYESLHPTMGDPPADSRYFPSITAYHVKDSVHAIYHAIKFQYVGFLENCPDCITLRARTDTAQDIVVKFVDRYGKKAHEILADVGLAPKLLYCGSPRSPRSNNNEPSYQSISMVVMEYVDGDTLAVAKQKMSKELVETVRSAVRRALDLLHDARLVFGDLRPPNVMITKDGQVKLIDFNWAGEEGQAKYPSLISTKITWPDGVKALNVMSREHDLDMLSKLI